MPELSLIKDLKNEPLALFVIGVILLLRIIDLLIKYVPQWFSKKKVMPLKVWQDTVINNIEGIKTELKTVSTTLLTHEFLLDKASEGTLENMLFDDHKDRSTFQKLKAFRRLLAMKKNGRIWERGKQLIIQHKETWLDVLDTELDIKIVDVEYFEARLKEIRRSIYDDYSEK
jgi:hypothetical protein